MDISSSSLKLRLSMLDIEELKPHEEVIQDIVAKLSSEIRIDGVVRDPLIVDEVDHVILDGMHRFNALKRLGCRFAPCCLLDYNDPRISVGSWFRTFTFEEPDSAVQKALSNLGLENSTTKLSEISNYDPDAIALTRDGSQFSLQGSMSVLERCRTAASIEIDMVKQGREVTYLSEAQAGQRLASGAASLMIILPVLTKDEVRTFGKEGSLFPHKVTRHVIPSRPLAVNVPLSLLTDVKLSTREADREFNRLLSARDVARKPAGSVIDGRHYDEELIIFSS